MIHQERIKEIQERIRENRAAAGYYAAVAKVIEKWSGKVYNKNMSEDLRTATNGMISGKKDNNRLYIEYHNKPRGKWYFITICNIDFDLLENKRINPDIILSDMREHREKLLKDAQAMENALENLDALTGQIETLKKTCRALFQNVPSVVLDAIGESRYTLRY